ETAQLPGWIARRMLVRGLKPGAGVTELLAYHMEGNLLACDQEIEKLAMLWGTAASGAPRTVAIEEIEGALSDNARFSVFQLADASLKGEARVVLRMLESLRAEGMEPMLVLWALTREARALASLSVRVAAGESVEQALDAARVWSRRKPQVAQALKRLAPVAWLGVLQRAARIDRVIKGRATGDAWRELQNLALAMTGLKPLSA
ncbi:MAG TPA: DNA polymerase III subunit delta, partial [Burkholderiales bacterium]|nr:DNA polymerase III subunit delta [Burkholderiales bacterium]